MYELHVHCPSFYHMCVSEGFNLVACSDILRTLPVTVYKSVCLFFQKKIKRKALRQDLYVFFSCKLLVSLH